LPDCASGASIVGMTDPQQIADNYNAIWIEPDPEKRRRMVAEIWAPDALHVLDPPQEVRETASGMRMRATFQSRGHAELEQRVASAYDEFIAPGEFTFRGRDDAQRVGDIVKFHWEMVRKSDGETMGVGLEIVEVDADGLIRRDHQFIES
jgi:hypothetical protein